MDLHPTNTQNREAAFTVVEMMVGVTIGSLVLAAVAFCFIFSLRSFASMANFAELNDRNRNASDLITRDIRNSYAVQSVSGSQIVFQGTNLSVSVTYTYDDAARTLTRTDADWSQTLLSGVDSCSFSLYLAPGAAATYGVATNTYTAATAATAKLVSFKWSCSRRIAGANVNTESVQTALVSLRNK